MYLYIAAVCVCSHCLTVTHTHRVRRVSGCPGPRTPSHRATPGAPPPDRDTQVTARTAHGLLRAFYTPGSLDTAGACEEDVRCVMYIKPRSTIAPARPRHADRSARGPRGRPGPACRGPVSGFRRGLPVHLHMIYLSIYLSTVSIYLSIYLSAHMRAHTPVFVSLSILQHMFLQCITILPLAE